MSTETYESDGAVPVELFGAAAIGKRPAVVAVYGTEGVNTPFGEQIRSFADYLVSKGYFVLIPHYFARTGTAAGPEALGAFVRCRDVWLKTIDDALVYAASRPEVEGDKVGLLGFSMGGHLALRAATLSGFVTVKAVVEFFAPITIPPFDCLGGDIDKLPPTQVHHGDQDALVPRQQSEELERLLVAAGKTRGRDYEIHFYAGEGHGFRGDLALDASKRRSAAFFDRYLK